MPYPSETYLANIQGVVKWVGDEFVSLYSQFVGYLSVEHNDDGTHGAVNATGSITAAGDLTVEGDGTFNGTVTADADGTPVTLSGDDGAFGPGIRLDGVTVAGGTWRISAPGGTGTRRLLFRDELNPGD